MEAKGMSAYRSEGDPYWSRVAPRRVSRRAALRGLGYTAAAGAGLSSLALAGCSSAKQDQASRAPGAGTPGQQGAGPAQSGGTYTFVAQGNALLDPHTTAGNTTMDVVGGVMSRLLRYQTGPDPSTINDHNLEPDLAASWESPDAVTWTFKLRPEAKFQDVAPVNGHAVEAEDVKASFTRALNTTSNPWRGQLSMIDPDQIQTPDAHTVVFKLKYAYAPFAKLMASATYAWIFPREALSGGYDPSKTIIGSGPFLFEGYQPDVAFSFKKNPNWFEKGRPYVDSVRAAIVTDPSQRLAQFAGGNLDEIAPDYNDIETIKKENPKARLVVGRSASGGGYPIYFQMGDPSAVFQDIRVRRAFSLAIDRDAIGKAIFHGQYVPAFLVAPGFGKWALKSSDLDPSVAQYFKYDPAQAKKLLEEAGATNLTLKFEYITNFAPFGPAYRTQAEMMNNMLNAIGVKTTLVPIDYLKDFIGAGKGTRYGYFPKDVILFGGVAVFSDVDEMLYQYFHSKSVISQTRVHDPKLDSMIDKARTLVNEDERRKAYLEVQKYIAEQMYAVEGTPQGFSYTMIQPVVQGYQYSNTLGVMTETYAKLWLKR